MKLILLLALCLLISCGQEPVAESNPADKLGQTLYLESDKKLSDQELSLFTTICSDLETKENIFKRNYSGTTSTITFSLSNKACNDDELKNDGDIASGVEETNGKLNFTGNLTFNDVIVPASVEVKDFCTKIQNNEHPDSAVKLGNKAYFYELYKSQDESCNGLNAETNMACLFIVTGVKKDIGTNAYESVEIEKIIINTDSGSNKVGMVEKRSFSENCTSNTGKASYTQKVQLLKSVN